MGALRTQFPALPQADPEAFAEVRTLGDVVAYMVNRDAAQPEPVQSTSNGNGTHEPSLPRGIVGLKELPQPDFSEYHLPENAVCLLTDNGTPAVTTLAAKLTGRNWKVVVLSFPSGLVPAQAEIPAGVQQVTLTDMSEEHLQQKLDEITRQFGPVGAVIHLNPPASGTHGSGLFSEVQKEINKHVFLLAKHLKEPLTQSAKGGHGAFLVVLQLDGEFGLGSEIDFEPMTGGLFGLVKTLNLEWESVFCRAVDISPEVAEDQAVRYIIAELFDPSRLVTEVGYSAKGRTTLVAEQAMEGEVVS